ncbi:hypothetical protein QAD02_010734 [Eretmocerus hayati]|uniref:Uncharacterized protein n=1 Tax=Eretmocerus hayati TaxID=131215 RepID=A0ACC2NUR9_9HYME|nr:hypothetical protein QAD02_010734 [Eretmocerus hayati]
MPKPKTSEEAQRARVRYPKDPQDPGYEYRLSGLLPANIEWPIYTVEVLGRSDNYPHASKKLESLESSHYALIMSSDANGHEVAQKKVEELRRSELMKREDEFSKKISSSATKQAKKEKKFKAVSVGSAGSSKRETQKCKKMISMEDSSKKVHQDSHQHQEMYDRNTPETADNADACSPKILSMNKRTNSPIFSQGKSAKSSELPGSILLQEEDMSNSTQSINEVLKEIKKMNKSLMNTATDFHKEIERVKSMIAKITIGENVKGDFIDDKEKLAKNFEISIPFIRSKYFENFDKELAKNTELVTLVKSKTIKDKEFRTALSSVITNVHGWKESGEKLGKDDPSTDNSTSADESNSENEIVENDEAKNSSNSSGSVSNPGPNGNINSSVSSADKSGRDSPELQASAPITDKFPNDLFSIEDFGDNVDTDDEDRMFGDKKSLFEDFDFFLIFNRNSNACDYLQ